MPDASDTPAPTRPTRGLLAGLAMFVAVFGLAGTWWLGSRAGWETPPGTLPPSPPIARGAAADDPAPSPVPTASVEELVEALATRLKDDPGNVEGWLMLGRSYAMLGRVKPAIAAFEQVLTVQPGNAEARAGLGTLAAAPPAGDRGGPAPPAAASAIRGRVELAPALAARASPGDTVFIFARPAEGSRMPLAILRKQVRDLPFDFTLDDSLAMSPQARLSQAKAVVVGARVSKSGQAMPQPGDLEGLSAPVAPGANGLVLVIGRVLP